jgi:hypothetical protein
MSTNVQQKTLSLRWVCSNNNIIIPSKLQCVLCVSRELLIARCALGLVLKIMKVDGFGKV